MPVKILSATQKRIRRTIAKQSTDDRIIQLRKALGLNLKEEARRYQFRMAIKAL